MVPIGFLSVIGGVGLYLFFIESHRPLFISPVSLKTAEIPEDDELVVLKKTLGRNKIEFETITASGSSYIVQLKGGKNVIFSTQKGITEQISSLQFILTRLTMEGKLFRQLDLRFDKPVIRE